MADTDVESITGTDPFALFEEWMAEAGKSEPNDPNAMALATADASGLPDVRMVLLKDAGPEGFVFYTNLESAKGTELAENPQAALCFHWKTLRRQIRARGSISPVSEAEGRLFRHPRQRQSDRCLGVETIPSHGRAFRTGKRSGPLQR